MKLFVKLMLALLVLAVLLPFTLLRNDQGQTLLSFSDLALPDFSLPELPSMSDAKRLVPAGNAGGGVDTFYRWYDADGILQFTTEPPPPGIEYTVKEVDPNVNLIRSVRSPDEESVPQAGANTLSAKPADASQDMDNPYDPDKMKKLFEDARNLEQRLQQRLDKQESTIN